MKATLEFNLHEDQHDFDCAVNGAKWMSAMWDLDQYLRSQTKYAPDTMSDDTHKAFEECREKLYEILNEEGLKL
jgi:uncharacterized short protein YbdD (DUF466 family)